MSNVMWTKHNQNMADEITRRREQARKIDESERVISHEEVSRRLFEVLQMLDSIAMVEPDFDTASLLNDAIVAVGNARRNINRGR